MRIRYTQRDREIIKAEYQCNSDMRQVAMVVMEKCPHIKATGITVDMLAERVSSIRANNGDGPKQNARHFFKSKINAIKPEQMPLLLADKRRIKITIEDGLSGVAIFNISAEKWDKIRSLLYSAVM